MLGCWDTDLHTWLSHVSGRAITEGILEEELDSQGLLAAPIKQWHWDYKLGGDCYIYSPLLTKIL